ncbi:hypothetical protein [Marinivivus vitaminiproducens]|uniref:hypothetical protein n=1 Tax=Marinivivus vitaminiproducens TaxID=3035935 RepID=UPI0027A87D6B|nr:hypothetical protein P4R82_21960 [Geminicoccaceae bacterium SCSIO 64248]
MRNHYKSDDVTSMVDKVFSGPATFHATDSSLFPDLSLHWVGGRTAGLQVVRARTARSFVALDSDAAHYYENLISRRPYPLIETMQDILDGFDRVEALADSASHIVPGHDPLVLSQYPLAAPGLDGVVRVNLPPAS